MRSVHLSWLSAILLIFLTLGCTSVSAHEANDPLPASTSTATPPTSPLPTPTPRSLFQPLILSHPSTPVPPTPTPTPRIPTPLGVAFGERSGDLDHFMDYIRDLGLNRTKLTFYWSDLEPEPDHFTFERLDAYLDQLQPGDQALLNLFTNGWCSEEDKTGIRKGSPLLTCPYDAPTCDKTCDVYYQEFIAAVAQRVKERAHGGIAYMQRDTEPASGRHFPEDEPQAYVAIQQIFYPTVKAILPDVLIIGVNHNGNTTPDGQPTAPAFFDYVLSHMQNDFDILDVRLYEDYETADERVAWFRDRMARYGYQKPIVTTEYGGPDPRTLHNGHIYLFSDLMRRLNQVCEDASPGSPCPRQWIREHPDQIDPKLRPFLGIGSEEENERREKVHCRDITQRTVSVLAAGTEATWWWNLQSPGTDYIFGQMRLRDQHLRELPGYACFKRMAQQMSGTTQVQRMPSDDPSLHLFRITRENQPDLYVAWYRDPHLDPFDSAAAAPVTVQLAIPYTHIHILDVFGHEWHRPTQHGILTLRLSDTPVFLTPDER